MRRLTIFILCLPLVAEVCAQGCSDAGFCTMGAMRPDQAYSRNIDFKLRALELNYYRGQTTLSPVVTVWTTDLTFGLNSKYSFQVKVPYQLVSGNLGNTQGLGDLSVSATRTLQLKRSSIGITLGGKIASGRADKARNDTKYGAGGDYPMYYQTSLGTYDLVAGASYITEKWLVAAGVQKPLIQHNENDFRWGQWADYPDQEYLRSYFLANYLKRGTDVMLRLERNVRLINFNFGLGALGIYRVSRDEVYNFKEDRREKLAGTTGLAFSMLAHVNYFFNVNNSIKLIYGKKLTDRKVNPDGLTRHAVLSVSYVYRF